MTRVPPRIAHALLSAAAIPLCRRRTLAEVYGTLRRRGMRPAAAIESVSRRFAVAEAILRPAIFGGVWDCPTCQRQSYRLPGPVVVYRDGSAVEDCCMDSREQRRAA